jgi:hypothetical protein
MTALNDITVIGLVQPGGKKNPFLLTAFLTWDVRAEVYADAPAWAVVKKADT